MSFELYDTYQNYTKRGSLHQMFNVARSDETLEELRYYAYLNDSGAHIIQRITTSGSLTVKVYGYYGTMSGDLNTNWANRDSLTYGEYDKLFSSG
jgi:hypothetical protein